MKKSITPIGTLLILLFLRIPVLFMGTFGIIPEEISLVVFLVVTYLVTAVFIVNYKNELCNYNITRSSVMVFLLAPIFSIMTMEDDPTGYLKSLISIVALIALNSKGYFKSSENKKFKFINIILVLISIGIFIFLQKYILNKSIDVRAINLSEFMSTFFFQISFAAVSEEPLFRGLIMGELMKKDIHPFFIILIQGGIFWLSHIYYINTGLNFWIIHPVVSILLGVVAYYGKSITNSMVLHGLLNTIGNVLHAG